MVLQAQFRHDRSQVYYEVITFLSVAHHICYDQNTWSYLLNHESYYSQNTSSHLKSFLKSASLNVMQQQADVILTSLWRQQMETYSALRDLCAGKSLVTGEFPAQRPVTGCFDVFFDMRLNKQLGKQSWGWWFQTPLRSLWRHCKNDIILDFYIDGLVQECSISSALAMGSLQSCTKPSIW